MVVTNSTSGLVSSNAVVRIIAAERLGAPLLLPGGRLQLLFNDADGGALLTSNDITTFQVLVSADLTNWTALTNSLLLTNGSMLLEDATTNAAHRFYKVLDR